MSEPAAKTQDTPAPKGWNPGPLFKILQPIAWWGIYPMVGLFGGLYWRWRAKGWQGIAKTKGPLLLLPNHTSAFDPVWAAYFSRRQVRFMASAQLFRFKSLSWLIRLYGAFPKAKFVKDKSAMEAMQRYWDEGRVVMIFPEGTRTWDGQTRHVIPGIGRLVRRLNARVVYCRIQTGHLHHPRWARYPRWVPMRLEYDGPHTYEDVSAAEIEEDANRRISIDANADLDGFSWGYKMAHGFPKYMWACPTCRGIDGLAVHPNDDHSVLCGRCGAGWTLDPNNRMHPMAGTPVEGQPVENVVIHRDRLIEALGNPPNHDPDRVDAEGIVLEERGGIGKVTRKVDPVPIATGLLRLTTTHLRVIDDDGETLWELELKRIIAVSFELGGVVQLRAPKGIYVQLEPVSGSTMKWGHYIANWAKAAGARRVRFG
jgi:1-acyl-sn-glycerol-3-phosphate acyltransferase